MDVSRPPTRDSSSASAPGGASPRAMLAWRLSSMSRVVAVVAPIAVIVYDAGWLIQECSAVDDDECQVLWGLTLPIAVIVLFWDLLVIASLFRSARGRSGIPHLLHSLLSFLIAAAALACFVATTSLAFAHDDPWTVHPIVLVLLMALIFVFALNDLAWALWGTYALRQARRGRDGGALFGPTFAIAPGFGRGNITGAAAASAAVPAFAPAMGVVT